MTTTLAFVLGICFVALMAALVLGKLAFFKAIKLRHDLLDTQTNSNMQVSDLWTTINANHEETFQEIGRVHQEINSGLDSKLNKLENKIPTLNK